MSFSESLVYTIEINPADLKGITASVATAAAAGLSKAMAGTGRGSGGTVAATATGSPGRVAAVAGGPVVGGANPAAGMAAAVRSFASAVMSFHNTVATLTKSITAMVAAVTTLSGATVATAAAATGATPPPIPGIPKIKLPPIPKPPRPPGRSSTPIMQTLGSLIGGQAGGLLSNFGARGGYGGAFGQALRHQGPAGAALRQRIGAIAGGMRSVGQGANQMAAGGVTANASTALHGLTSAAQGVASMLGPEGQVVSAVIGTFHKFIDAMDTMVSQLGKYNGITAAAMGQYEAQQIMMQVELSQILEPLMTWWVKLKSGVLSSLMDALRDILTPIMDFLTETKLLDEVTENVIDIFKSLWDAVKEVIKGIVDMAISAVEFSKWLDDWLGDSDDDDMSKQKLRQLKKDNPNDKEIQARSEEDLPFQTTQEFLDSLKKLRDALDGAATHVERKAASLWEGMHGYAVFQDTGRAVGHAIHQATSGWRRGFAPGWNIHPKHELQGPGTGGTPGNPGVPNIVPDKNKLFGGLNDPITGPAAHIHDYMKSAVSAYSYLKKKNGGWEYIPNTKDRGPIEFNSDWMTAGGIAGGRGLTTKPPDFTPIEKLPEFQLKMSMQNKFEIHNEQMLHAEMERLRHELWKATRQGEADGRLALTMLGVNAFGGDGL